LQVMLYFVVFLNNQLLVTWEVKYHDKPANLCN